MKKVFAAFLGLVLALCLPSLAFAEHIDGDTGWFVEYNSAGEVVDNYSQGSWAETLSKLQPGDDITLSIEVRHNNDTAGDWYLSNAVLKSFEDSENMDSAYGYKLSYEGPTNSRTLYESKSVGGIGSAAGLADATNAMDDYFYLGTLAKGETARVTLNVSLDGETEGNAYFDALAKLALKFAVEPNTEGQTTVKNETVEKNETVTTAGDSGGTVNHIVSGSKSNLAKTGDRTTMLPLYLAIAGVGIVCLALAIKNVRNKKEQKEEGDA